jgi:hypothetical protein
MSIHLDVERISRMVNIINDILCGEFIPGKRFNDAK